MSDDAIYPRWRVDVLRSFTTTTRIVPDSHCFELEDADILCASLQRRHPFNFYAVVDADAEILSDLEVDAYDPRPVGEGV